MKVTLVVCVLDDENRIIGAYRQREKLSFVPTVGMKLRVNSSSGLWKTTDGGFLDPTIKEIVYNMDDAELYCLFEVNQFLASSYWAKINDLNNNHELRQFSIQSVEASLCGAGAEDSGSLQKHASKVFILINMLIPVGIIVYRTLSEAIIDGIL